MSDDLTAFSVYHSAQKMIEKEEKENFHNYVRNVLPFDIERCEQKIVEDVLEGEDGTWCRVTPLKYKRGNNFNKKYYDYKQFDKMSSYFREKGFTTAYRNECPDMGLYVGLRSDMKMKAEFWKWFFG